MQLRDAVPADAAVLQALAREATTAPQWSAAAWREVLAPESVVQRHTILAEQQSSVAGFVVVNTVGDIAEIESIAVRASCRRQGIASSLLHAAADWARALNAKVLELEVRASNEEAIAFYRALGFAQQGTRAKYYSQPQEDAVLFALAL
jgi:ribosomal-protein-alanine N-acetyltransferase